MQAEMENASTPPDESGPISPEMQRYFDAAPDCPWPGVRKLEWLTQIVGWAGDGPYDYDDMTQYDEVMRLVDEECYAAVLNKRITLGRVLNLWHP